MRIPYDLSFSYHLGTFILAAAEESYYQGFILSALSPYFASKESYQSLGQKFNLLIPYANPQEGRCLLFPINQLFQLDKVFMRVSVSSWPLQSFIASVRLLGLFVNLGANWALDGKYYRIGAGVLAVGVTLFCPQMMRFSRLCHYKLIQNSLENSFVARHNQSIYSQLVSSNSFWVTKIIG